MKHEDDRKGILSDMKGLASGARRLMHDLEGTTPTRRHARVNKTMAPMLTGAGGVLGRLPAERERIRNEEDLKEQDRAQMVAGVARFHVEPRVQVLAKRYRDLVARARRDVSLSFPNARDHMQPGDMLVYHLLMEQLRATIESAPVADLLQRYERAELTRDTRGEIEATLIEERIERRGGLATKPEDLPLVKRLTEWIEGVQDLRVDEILPSAERVEVESVIEFARKAVSLADVAQVRPVNTDHAAHADAKAAFEAETGEYRAALEAAAAAAAGDEESVNA